MFPEQGFIPQGFSQRSLMQALFVGQSELLLQPRRTQETLGLPPYPDGHSQIALWLIPLH